ncbi:hypothetical protein ILUMI_07504 [Ignelater luminosus]|uniref:C2H2-type domain-containing protein n=1 Tax=Ignelater luminosus TaxID=2038154 RepID=A0A8K0D3D1_IGNLU|nr:hypothetical protein ILUMI_07504 [Ignelater luminosus]
MKANYFTIEILVLYVLSLIPWPGPTIFKISCPKDNARIVRKIIQNKWIPVLEKYKVSIPLECPFHPLRDIFGPQEAAKQQHRPSQWTCGLCGKSFFEERYLDLHFDNRHKGHINMAEDAVCLADYCDIIRCDVLKTQDEKIVYPDTVNTDIEIWREASTYRTELVPASSKDLTKYKRKDEVLSPARRITNNNNNNNNNNVKKLEHCQKYEGPDATTENSDESNSNEEDKSQNISFNNVCQSDLVDSALPASDKQQRIAELQKLKANCKPEELQTLRNKCEILVRDCIAGLLLQLSVKDFKEIEDELNRAVCWYLTCDRYWEDSHGDFRQFPWGLVCLIVMVLSLGICICYYIIWVLFDTDDLSVTSASVTDRSTPSPAHALRHEASQSLDGHQAYGDDYYAPSDKDNEYIYVTYPPDLKRRLLESCYNRTTRL